MSATYV
jgi:hypothetical protein